MTDRSPASDASRAARNPATIERRLENGEYASHTWNETSPGVFATAVARHSPPASAVTRWASVIDPSQPSQASTAVDGSPSAHRTRAHVYGAAWLQSAHGTKNRRWSPRSYQV